jgi:hypothetical protein
MAPYAAILSARGYMWANRRIREMGAGIGSRAARFHSMHRPEYWATMSTRNAVVADLERVMTLFYRENGPKTENATSTWTPPIGK